VSDASDYLQTQIVKHLLQTNNWTKPVTIYVALYTDAGGGAEVSAGGYSRVQHGPANGNWSMIDGVASNIGAITFGTPTASWGTVTKFALFDAVTGGNPLIYGNLTESLAISSGSEPPSFAEGALTITLL
jgi:hypothetical protein